MMIEMSADYSTVRKLQIILFNRVQHNGFVFFNIIYNLEMQENEFGH